MPTKPATKPVLAPTNVGFLSAITSQSIQESMPAAEETAVVTNACAAKPSAASAEPALNPNHPNQRREAPRTTDGIL